MALVEKRKFRIERTTFLKQAYDDNLPKGVGDLCENAIQLSFNFEQNIQWTQNNITKLSLLLDDAYFELQPSQVDCKDREYVIQFLDNLVRRQIPGSRIAAFGSYVMDMFTSRSDLDLSLMIGDEDYSREEKLRFLKRLRKSLYQLENGPKTISKIQAVMHATVPVIKFVVNKTGTECDISVENRDGVLKSTLVRIISSIDARFKKLCYLLKHWAKAQGINEAKEGTLSSFAIILFVAFLLQTRSPPILPPLGIFLEGLDLIATSSFFSEVERRVQKFKLQNVGRINTESVAQLFAAFFAKWVAVEKLWQQGLCASAYEGRWIVKRWVNNATGIISVEDFTDRSQNTARAVSRKEFDRIYSCFKNSLAAVQKPLTSKRDSDELKNTLFASHIKLGKRHLEEQLFSSRKKQKNRELGSTRNFQQTADLKFPENEHTISVRHGSMQIQTAHIPSRRQEKIQFHQSPAPIVFQSFPSKGQNFSVPHYVTAQPAIVVPSGRELFVGRSYEPQTGFSSVTYPYPQKVLVPQHLEYHPSRYAYPYHQTGVTGTVVQPSVEFCMVNQRRT